MDMITTENLESLLDRRAEWCVSLYMPTHRAGRETEQDPTRLKNLLRLAEERLKAKGLRSPEALGLLEPAQRLLKDPAFWRRQSDGLVFFLSPGEMSYYRLPMWFEELAVVAHRFHIKPLLPLLVTDGHFYILALSQNQIRVLEGTRHTVDEIDIDRLPTSLKDVLGEGFERQLQFHTRTSARPGERSAVFHGHDIGDETKGKILGWFHRIDEGLSEILGGGQSPLVLAGVEYLLPLYRQASSYRHLIEDGIQGNPDDLKPGDLHGRAWELVRPRFEKAELEAAARYRKLAGTGRTTTDVREAVEAAGHGRVDVLFVGLGSHVWGSVDMDTGEVDVHHEPDPGDVDLLDLAAVRTLRNGGAAYAVDGERVPGGGVLAAVFRY